MSRFEMGPTSAAAPSPRVLDSVSCPATSDRSLRLTEDEDLAMQKTSEKVVLSGQARPSEKVVLSGQARPGYCFPASEARFKDPFSCHERSMETSKMCLKSILPPNEDGDVLSSSQANDGGSSPDCYSGRNVSPQGSSTGKSLCIENSCSADSCVESDVGRSSAKAYDRKALCVKPSSMKRLSSGVASLTSAMSKCGKRGSLATVISISRTEKETIVHTDLLNFRRIVHQLTGASRNEEALMPVTISSRARGSIDESINCLYNDKDFNKDKDLTQPKPLCAKLYERRSPKTLENIMASCRELPPLVPSPVTPMSSGFERTLPATRAASPGDVQQEHNNIQAEWKTTEIDRIGNVHLSCKQNQLGTQAHFNLTQGQPIDANQWLSTLGGTYQVESVEDMVIAEKGFFLHPQRPRDNEPALLSLFPESPRG